MKIQCNEKDIFKHSPIQHELSILNNLKTLEEIIEGRNVIRESSQSPSSSNESVAQPPVLIHFYLTYPRNKRPRVCSLHSVYP